MVAFWGTLYAFFSHEIGYLHFRHDVAKWRFIDDILKSIMIILFANGVVTRGRTLHLLKDSSNKNK